MATTTPAAKGTTPKATRSRKPASTPAAQPATVTADELTAMDIGHLRTGLRTARNAANKALYQAEISRRATLAQEAAKAAKAKKPKADPAPLTADQIAQAQAAGPDPRQAKYAQVVERLQAGESPTAIADSTPGVGIERVRKLAAENGIELKPRRRSPEKGSPEFAQMLADVTALEERYGIGFSRIYDHVVLARREARAAQEAATTE